MHNYLVEGGWNGGFAGDSGGMTWVQKAKDMLLHKLTRLLPARRREAMGKLRNFIEAAEDDNKRSAPIGSRTTRPQVTAGGRQKRHTFEEIWRGSKYGNGADAPASVLTYCGPVSSIGIGGSSGSGV